jgi:hypothetical protein
MREATQVRLFRRSGTPDQEDRRLTTDDSPHSPPLSS